MFVCDDFVTCKALYQVQYDYFYSRWTIHAVSEKQEWELLKNVSSAIKKKGLFFINKARSSVIRLTVFLTFISSIVNTSVYQELKL